MQKETIAVFISMLLVGGIGLFFLFSEDSNTGFASKNWESPFKIKPIAPAPPKNIRIEPLSNKNAPCRMLHSTCFGAYPVCSRVTCKCVTAEVEREQIDEAGPLMRECVDECFAAEVVCSQAGRTDCRVARRDCVNGCNIDLYCQRT